MIQYFESDEPRNVLDLWNLENEDRRYKLLVCRINGEVKAHLGTYDTPEAIYSSLGGETTSAEALIDFIPRKTILTTTRELGDLIGRRLKFDASYPNDIMMVRRGEEKLTDPGRAVRLSIDNDIQYSEFGSSFKIKNVSMEWIREQLATATIFGVYVDHALVSVASLVGRLPSVSEIMAVETKPEFRGRGFGSIAVSAAVREGLKQSITCSLFVRQDNSSALAIYKKIGFNKVGELLWIDLGSGLVP